MGARYSDATREWFAGINALVNLIVPKTALKRDLIAIRIQDKIGVIFHQRKKKIYGLLSPDDVDMANVFPMFAKIGERNNIRIYIKDTRPEIVSTLPLAVAVMCKNRGVFFAEDANTHHELNSADNRIEHLENKEPHSTHPPKCYNSLVHFQNVFAGLGLSYEEVVEICVDYIKNLKRT